MGWYSVWTGEHLYLLRGLSYLSERMSEIVREAGEQARPAEAGTAERNNSEIMKLTHTHTHR